MRVWVDTNDLRPGAQPILFTPSPDGTQPDETTRRCSRLEIDGPCAVVFDGEAEGHARVWVEVPDSTPVRAADVRAYA